MNSREFKDTVYHQFSRVGKVLSSPKRLELLDLLSQGPKSVEVLSNETKMSIANTSKHLQALLEARLVGYRKEKNYVIYHLISDTVIHLLSSIKSVAEEQIEEINSIRNQFIVRPETLQTIELSELVNRIETGTITLIDVRSTDEYDAGHIEGAISIPIQELSNYLSKLPNDSDVVAYCRGPYCVYATEAVEYLLSKGYSALRLEAGIHEWKQILENQIENN